MKKKLLSIVLCMALIFGCCATFMPAEVQAKKFKKKLVKMVKFAPKGGFYLPEDDVSSDACLLFFNKNKKPAEVTFDVYYYKGKGANKKCVKKEPHARVVFQMAYDGIGNDEEMVKYDSYKIKHYKVKKSNVKVIPKKKVVVKNKKFKDGTKGVTIKNNSKIAGYFEIVNVYYNKNGKIKDFETTTASLVEPGKKEINTVGVQIPKKTAKRVKTFYNYYEYRE